MTCNGKIARAKSNGKIRLKSSVSKNAKYDPNDVLLILHHTYKMKQRFFFPIQTNRRSIVFNVKSVNVQQKYSVNVVFDLLVGSVFF